MKGAFVGENNFERYQNARYNNKNLSIVLLLFVAYCTIFIPPNAPYNFWELFHMLNPVQGQGVLWFYLHLSNR